MAAHGLHQQWRFLVFALNVATFYIVYLLTDGDWTIGGSGQAAWVIAAVGWWVLELLSAPWFRPPRDALAASIAAFSVLVTMDLGNAGGLASDQVGTARTVATIYVVIIGISAVVAAHREGTEERGPIQRAALVIASDFARGEALFGGVALVSIFGFYNSDPVKLGLVALWTGFALLRPFEKAIDLLLAIRNERSTDRPSIGSISRVDDPGIVRVSIADGYKWDRRAMYLTRLPGGAKQFVLPLFTQIREDGLLGTGICAGDASEVPLTPHEGAVHRLDSSDRPEELMAGLANTKTKCDIAGFVVEGSRIGTIRFEVARPDDLEEGVVVFCQLGAKRVFYQIVGAQTSEESFMHNPRGTHIVTAVQLGTHDPARGFRKHPWLPSMNQIVFRPTENPVEPADPADDEFAIGSIPTLDLEVRAGISDLIEYHSAILGATGTGKTELALDVINNALDRDTKVVVVDLTGEYRQRLANRSPQSIGLTQQEADDLDAKLFAVETGDFGAKKERKVLKGFLDEIRGVCRDRVDSFLQSEEDWLAILELAEVTNTRATLRTTELFLSEILMWARSNRRTRRILIVLEEAHTIIPEVWSSGFDSDTQWVVNRIGQIALQGRKYGVGLMVISQRTALVSKTILSQCNTYLVYSMVDQTSLSYLSNVLGSIHVEAIPNLRFLEFIAFGKAIRSERPTILHRAYDEAVETASRTLT